VDNYLKMKSIRSLSGVVDFAPGGGFCATLEAPLDR
jgi:hypothetical protein